MGKVHVKNKRELNAYLKKSKGQRVQMQYPESADIIQEVMDDLEKLTKRVEKLEREVTKYKEGYETLIERAVRGEENELLQTD